MLYSLGQLRLWISTAERRTLPSQEAVPVRADKSR